MATELANAAAAGDAGAGAGGAAGDGKAADGKAADGKDKDKDTDKADEPIKTALGDPVAVKHALDEQTAAYFLDELGYADDVTLSNVKLAIGAAAILVAAFAQFYPVPFPASASVLQWCVGVYWVLHAVVQCMHWVTDADCVLITKPKMHGVGASRRREPALAIRTDMKRYDTEYRVAVQQRTPARGKRACAKAEAKLQCTDFFDANGVFLTAPFVAAMQQLMADFESAQRNE